MRNPHSIDAVKQVERFPRAASAAFLLAVFVLAIFASSALAASTNLVKNGSFEKDGNGDGIPNDWADLSGGGIAPKRVCNQSYAGACSLKVVIDGFEKQVQQSFALDGLEGQDYKLTFWAMGKGLVNGVGKVYFVVSFGGILQSSNSVEVGNSPWTKISLIATADQDFDLVGVWLYSNAEGGKAWIDKVKMVALP